MWQPLPILFGLAGRALDAGQSHCFVAAETENHIVCAGRGNWPDRQTGPLWHLVGDEGCNQTLARCHFVCMHLWWVRVLIGVSHGFGICAIPGSIGARRIAVTRDSSPFAESLASS